MSAILAEDTFTVTMAAIVRYAGASGDFTPIHYDAETLAAAGYDDFFAMGMLTAGRLGALLATTFGDEAVRELRVRFREPAWVGSRIALTIREDGPAERGRRTVRLVASVGEAGDDEERVIVDGEAVITTPADQA